MNRTTALALAALSLFALLTPSCATNPVTGRREISLVSGAQEEQIGREGLPAVIAEYGRYDVPAVQALVDSVGWRLARVSHMPSLDWHFTVLDDQTVNAFAMPGGYIYVTRGILAHLNSEAQLAGVLGHEIGHVTHRHTAAAITRQQLYGLGLGVASALSSSVRQYSGAAQQALGLLFLRYSRENENEADQLGVDYATKAGYDPREIPNTYAMLKRVSEAAGQRMPAFLSTHPDPGDREARTTELARVAAAGKAGLVIRQRDYEQRLEGVVFGADPRQGYFEGAHYYQPAMGFEMAFPAGWQYQDTRSAVSAGISGGAAMMQLSLVANEHGAPLEYVNRQVAAAKFSRASGAAERIGGYDAWAGRVSVTKSDGTPATYDAIYVRKGADQLFQILGLSAQPGDANDQAIFASARSFRALADAARLDPQPQRVHVVASPAAADFQTILGRLGPQALKPEETAVINNLQLDENVGKGQLIKIVLPGRTR